MHPISLSRGLTMFASTQASYYLNALRFTGVMALVAGILTLVVLTGLFFPYIKPLLTGK